MNGRLERDLKEQAYISTLLQKLPSIVTDYYNVTAASKTPITCRNYILYIRKLYRFLSSDPQGYDITKVTEAEVAQFLQTQAKKQNGTAEASFSNRKLAWAALNSFFTYLEKRGVILSNVMRFTEPPKQRDNVKRILLTENDVNALLKYIRTEDVKDWKNADMVRARNVCIVTLMACTGMRVSAVSQIDCSDIDLSANTVTVTDKRHKTTVYALNEMERKAIYKWLFFRQSYLSERNEETDALFISQEGTRMSVRMIHEMLGIYSEKALGYKISPHKLRAAFCSILYDKTKDIEFVRDAVGHSSTSVTQRYIVKKESAQKQAAEMLENIFTV